MQEIWAAVRDSGKKISNAFRKNIYPGDVFLYLETNVSNVSCNPFCQISSANVQNYDQYRRC